MKNRNNKKNTTVLFCFIALLCSCQRQVLYFSEVGAENTLYIEYEATEIYSSKDTMMIFYSLVEGESIELSVNDKKIVNSRNKGRYAYQLRKKGRKIVNVKYYFNNYLDSSIISFVPDFRYDYLHVGKDVFENSSIPEWSLRYSNTYPYFRDLAPISTESSE